MYITACILSTAAYLLLMRKLRDTTSLNEMSLLYYNNILGLPLMAGWLVLGTDELNHVWGYEYLLDPKFLLCLLFSASQAFVLNMCIFRCTSINSPLATSVTGQIKDIATTSLGVCAASSASHEHVAHVCACMRPGIVVTLPSSRQQTWTSSVKIPADAESVLRAVYIARQVPRPHACLSTSFRTRHPDRSRLWSPPFLDHTMLSIRLHSAPSFARGQPSGYACAPADERVRCGWARVRFAGLVLFGNIAMTNVNIAGLVVGLIGGMVYSGVSYFNSVKAYKAEKRHAAQ